MNSDVNLGFVVFQNSVTVFMNDSIRTIFTITGNHLKTLVHSYIETKHTLD